MKIIPAMIYTNFIIKQGTGQILHRLKIKSLSSQNNWSHIRSFNSYINKLKWDVVEKKQKIEDKICFSFKFDSDPAL